MFGKVREGEPVSMRGFKYKSGLSPMMSMEQRERGHPY